MAKGQFRNRHSGGKGRGNTAKPPLTHCKCHFVLLFLLLIRTGFLKVLSLPIGHHVLLQKSVSSFTSGLLETTPMLPGLDRTVVIPPRRLHLTLGVMSLEDSEASSIAFESQAINARKTLSEALSLLSSLRPQVSELLCGAPLKVPLQMMDIMPPDGGDPDKAHVLWFGPSLENEDAQRLREVGGEWWCCRNFFSFADDLSEMVTKTFIEAGFIKDRRPLKVRFVFCFFLALDESVVHQLHCTILNTTYRRPRARGLRQPFSYRSLLESPAAQAFLSEPRAEPDLRHPVTVNFGTWDVDEIQICKMGSYGPEGEYESCGGLLLSQPQPR
ncbi:hypothetical protein J3R83DRAFT_13435 [Lanmaoa asiatica]|nr:hypothetical protein J3R83DRAFT_13435 [Lanmaoa asiatica]